MGKYMGSLVEEMAELLYSADVPPWDWARASDEEREYYFKISEVLVDALTDYLEAKDIEFVGGFRATVDFLRSETEIARLRRARV